ncbi:sialate:O-sulfotransferase 2-like [Diadema setosum]|uniref:sialate:O-sulfotransferase 2-like n=1 Tax=Diadema setosum TaxID=31175 RepID=UPI003B3BA3CC
MRMVTEPTREPDVDSAPGFPHNVKTAIETPIVSGVSQKSVRVAAVPQSVCEHASLAENGTLPLLGLASFPGSGNTWLRYLIERATGVYTGSVFCDKSLLNGGFLGECERADCGCTSVVKMHWFLSGYEYLEWKGGILLLRNPYNALVAEWNRRKGKGHIGHAAEETFRTPEWNGYVLKEHLWWIKITTDALARFGPRVMVVHYEHLVTDLATQLGRVVSFLGIASPNLEHRLRCAVDHATGNFKRTRPNGTAFDPFTEEHKTAINETIREVMAIFRDGNFTLPPYALDYV